MLPLADRDTCGLARAATAKLRVAIIARPPPARGSSCMLARLRRSRALLDDAALTRFDHALIVLPFARDADALPEFPQRARLEAALAGGAR
ncbi:MAG: hypothetical protein MZW92_39070 [Comamonadaceae bacterium]|nr:hypothetical protein [Comamonadaceae bacterium]